MKSYKVIKVVVAVFLVLSLLSAAIYVFSTGKNRRIIYSHRNEYHQVLQHLFNRDIVENQIAGEIIDKYPPTIISAHDNFITFQYFKSNEQPEDCCVFYSYYVHIIAKDNRLVKAFASEGFVSTIDHVFFDSLDDLSEDEYWDSRMNNAVSSSSI